jgi:hypothetical protein
MYRIEIIPEKDFLYLDGQFKIGNRPCRNISEKPVRTGSEGIEGAGLHAVLSAALLNYGSVNFFKKSIDE